MVELDIDSESEIELKRKVTFQLFPLFFKAFQIYILCLLILFIELIFGDKQVKYSKESEKIYGFIFMTAIFLMEVCKYIIF